MVHMQFDEGAGAGMRLGMVVLSTDETLEYEAKSLLEGHDVNLMHTRIASAPEVTPSSLRDMKARMPASAGLLPTGLKALGYGCTSASVLIGPDAVEKQIATVQPDVPVTNPISAVVVALQALNVQKIGLVTPYTAEVAAPMQEFLSVRGIATLAEISFGEASDPQVAKIAQSTTLEAIGKAGSALGVEAVFVSCTNLGTFKVIETAEARLGIPVISSNLAFLWHMLRLAGAKTQGWGPGRLFQI